MKNTTNYSDWCRTERALRAARAAAAKRAEQSPTEENVRKLAAARMAWWEHQDGRQL